MLVFAFLLLFLIDRIKACPLTDEYLSRCHCEILTNAESYIKCDENSLQELPKFKRSFPYDELLLSNNRIRTLPASSFDHIKTIRRINLQGNSLSFIDPNLLRLLGNYLEELTLTADDQIDSLEFLTRYPLRNLRVLKLDHFNLSTIDLKKTFLNLTKLELVSLTSCQLTEIPNLPHLHAFNLENNLFSNTLFLSTTYQHLNLANNQISSIILQTNDNLISLNLSKNRLNEFYSSTISNKKLQSLDLSQNQLSSIDWTIFTDSLTSLNLSANRFRKINFNSLPKSLLALDLHSNQLKTIEKTSLFEQLTSLDLNHNPFDCTCHLKWLGNLMKKFNTSIWACAASDFKCQVMPRVLSFNITYISTPAKSGLLVQWFIVDKSRAIHHLQISIEQPYRLSEKISSEQRQVFISNDIQSNQLYHVCLILMHKFARDKYCRDILTKTPVLNPMKFQDNEILFPQEIPVTTQSNDKHLYLLLIGSCIGGLLTFILLLTCCYLCYQIHRYRTSNKQPTYEKCSQHFHYPIYHSHPSCPHQQMIYNSENISNSTDSSHMDTSLSTATNNPKHIYQTIDSQDYCSLKRQHQQMFDLWKESVQQTR